MIIKNADISGKIQDIEIKDGKIAFIGKSSSEFCDIDAMGQKVVPGMIDLHIHGCMGHDTMDGDFEPICDYLARHGTTSFLPTTMTMDEKSIAEVTNSRTDFKGAEILGFHLEGPYISENRSGAQSPEYIRDPSETEFGNYSRVRMITLAPERKGSLDFIKKIKDKAVVSIGHTDCDFDTAERAFENGAKCLTHIFNAMPPLLHRSPGPIGAALMKNAYVQLISDGLHVHRALVAAVFKMFGANRVLLISDSIRPAGLNDGEYICGGMKVKMTDGKATVENGHLAGSTTPLFECVKNAVRFGIPFDDAVKAATETPAKLIGENHKGKILPGFDADLLVLDKSLNIRTVIIGGEIYC